MMGLSISSTVGYMQIYYLRIIENRLLAQPFPVEIGETRRLKMTSDKIFCLNFALFIKFLYVCMTKYAESYALRQQVSLACSGYFRPETPKATSSFSLNSRGKGSNDFIMVV